MARINFVNAAAHDQGECRACHRPIVKGMGYKFFQLYKRTKSCYHAGCAIPRSHTTGSDKLARVYEALETAEKAVSDWSPAAETYADLEAALAACAEDVQAVADEYRESADNIHQTFSESTTADECEEKADELESWVGELEVSFDDFEFDEVAALADIEVKEPEAVKEALADARAEALETWADEQRQAAEDALSACPV